MLTLGIYFCVKLGLLQLYPAYITYKAIKVNNQKEYSSLLTFWVVSISFLAVEYFSDIFLFWFPFYTEIKLIIVLWLILPQTQGASVFYTSYLDPFLQTHEHDIDNTLLEIQAKLKESVLIYGKHLIESIKRIISDTVFKGSEATAEQPLPPPQPAEQDSGSIISPYNLFSTFILKSVIANTASASAPAEAPAQAPAEAPAQAPAQAPAHTPAQTLANEEVELERTDSHDSFVNIKSTDTTPAPLTWTGYISSFVWKQPEQEIK